MILKMLKKDFLIVFVKLGFVNTYSFMYYLETTLTNFKAEGGWGWIGKLGLDAQRPNMSKCFFAHIP